MASAWVRCVLDRAVGSRAGTECLSLERMWQEELMGPRGLRQSRLTDWQGIRDCYPCYWQSCAIVKARKDFGDDFRTFFHFIGRESGPRRMNDQSKNTGPWVWKQEVASALLASVSGLSPPCGSFWAPCSTYSTGPWNLLSPDCATAETG